MAASIRIIIRNPNELRNYQNFLNFYTTKGKNPKTTKLLEKITNLQVAGAIPLGKVSKGRKASNPTFQVEGAKLLEGLQSVLGSRFGQSSIEARAAKAVNPNKEINSIEAKTPISSSVVSGLRTRFEETAGTPEQREAPIDVTKILRDNKEKVTNSVLFKAISSDANMKALFWENSRVLNISSTFSEGGKKARTSFTHIAFSKNEFIAPPFITSLDPINNRIKTSLNATYTKALIKGINRIVPTYIDKVNKEFNEGILKISRGVKPKQTIGYNASISISFKTQGNRIPMSSAIIKKSPSAFNKERQVATSKGQFVSKSQLNAIIGRHIQRSMRKGGGPPRKPILTYRTGQFANDTEVIFLDHKNKVIRYFFDHKYLHNEPRNYIVSDLVEDSIRAAMAQSMGIVRASTYKISYSG